MLCCVGGAVWCGGKGMEVGGGVVRSFSKKDILSISVTSHKLTPSREHEKIYIKNATI